MIYLWQVEYPLLKLISVIGNTQLQVDKYDPPILIAKMNMQPIRVWAHWGGPNPW